MKQKELFADENNEIRERYELAMERITLIEQEQTVKEKFVSYFKGLAAFLLKVKDVVNLVEEDKLKDLSLEELQKLNKALYEDVAGDHYATSFANPTYACEQFGEQYGQMLALLATELKREIVFAYESRHYELTIYLELFIEIYNYFEEEDEDTHKDIKKAIYDFMFDYCDIMVDSNIRELIDTDMSFARDIIMDSDLNDLRYLYQFGEYITENELKTADFLNSLPQEQIDAMAHTFTEGYRLGFISNQLDLSKKKIVNVRYQLGFERMVRSAVHKFRALGLEISIQRATNAAAMKRQHFKIGYHATSPNRQYDYDHRYDIGLFLDKAYKERKLECNKNSVEKYKDKTVLFAGPALIQVFGEELFAPEENPNAVKLDERQQKLYVDFYSEDSAVKQKYMKLEETSFTIISYPVPQIGDDFNDIFKETVKVNTLDSDLYGRIQQRIIDVLDQGDQVHVLGAGKNHTDITVNLYELNDPSSETIFENCVADVNIPVGEVFTSPVLKGTNGTLHVPKIYLNDLEYRELELVFEDGRIASYSCKNYEDEEKNKSYLKENLFSNQEALPIGEFAIGTNTTAYMMAKKFDIASRLPILIAEKTGPHFAIGDTCYKYSEDTVTYNSDGKKVVARDNEVSILRKSEPEKAYFNCHTDITLPYDELKEISVIKKDGTVIPIILDARFVLDGTEELNKAFDE